LFDIYDVDQSGELDYKEFVGSLYSNQSISKEEPKSGKKGQSQDDGKKGSEGKSKKAYLQVEGYFYFNIF
jgi:hypothetical protein